MESICKWEQRLKQYEEQSADVVSDTIKTAVLTSRLVDPELQRHLNLQAARLPDVRRRSKTRRSTTSTLRHPGAEAETTRWTSRHSRSPRARVAARAAARRNKAKDVCFYCGQALSPQVGVQDALPRQGAKVCRALDKAGRISRSTPPPASAWNPMRRAAASTR